MKKSEFQALALKVLPELDGFAAKGGLLLARPVDGLLRGIAFEGSSFNKTSFYATVFVMPLCKPTNHLSFTFGQRLRHEAVGERWNATTTQLPAKLIEAIRGQAIPFLAQGQSLADFIDLAQSEPKTLRVLEAMGFAQARAGRFPAAIETFDAVLQMIDLNVQWQSELAATIEELKAMLVRDPGKVREHLLSFEANTIHALGLDDF